MVDSCQSFWEWEGMGLNGFRSENHLFRAVVTSQEFDDVLHSGDSLTHLLIEPKGLFGVPDILLANIQWSASNVPQIRSIAFELKLRDWRRGLRQAYRYRAFANQSYVVLDASNARSAIQNTELFVRSNIGLIAVDQAGKVIIHREPVFSQPFSRRQELNFHVGLLDLVSTAQDQIDGPFTFVLQDLRFSAIG